ncbi:hypothetical protein ACEPT7_09220 [Burkholderia ubonensis]|uniref:hypothetical protein n=1 Tax=Burkholderia ubonensis TaxID=101571 RepID=UPI00358FF6F9
MLRVTVELWPGGRESSKRVIATADVGRVRSGVLADYRVHLEEMPLGTVGDDVIVHGYPRWSASIWDMVARCIAVALSGGREELPQRPVTPDVPVRTSGTVRYIQFNEIPEPARTFFRRNVATSSCPVIDEATNPMDCAYAEDWESFLSGDR